MPKKSLPAPSIRITKTEARRFMLAHQYLYPPRSLQGKPGILAYFKRVSCLQFDPINIVGRNPDLVLQSRLKNYTPALLEDLLYGERILWDGWDKMASIYAIEDWPFFSRYRSHMSLPDTNTRRPSESELQKVLTALQQRGPLSSLDFKDSEIVDWFWGPTKIARAGLESLFSMGQVGVHHRVNNRRVFDLVEKLVPAKILQQNDPFETEEAYQEWHLLRRIGGIGLASSRSGDYWLGILGVKSQVRQRIFRRLVNRGDLLAIAIEDIPGETFFIRRQDRPQLDGVPGDSGKGAEAAFIAALDNLIWNRNMIQQIFDFDYVWEVYKPKTQRKYGYYVLPVIYGDRFIARFEPFLDRQENILIIKNWWWEDQVHPDTIMNEKLKACLDDFSAYLGASSLQLEPKVNEDTTLQWMKS